MHSPSEQKRNKCAKQFEENITRSGDADGAKAILHAVSVRYEPGGGTSIATTLSTTLGYIISPPGTNAASLQQQQRESSPPPPPPPPPGREQQEAHHPRQSEIEWKVAQLIAQARALGEMMRMADDVAEMVEEMSMQLRETRAELLELTKLPGGPSRARRARTM